MAIKKFRFCIVLSIFSVVNCGDTENNYFLGEGIPQNSITKQLNHNTEIGPLSPDVLKKNPNIAFVGNIDNKNYYIERTNATWPEGNDTCNELGMKMATFHNKSESDFVYKKLPDSDGIVWTGALIRHDYSHYLWTSDKKRMFPTTLWAFNDTDTVLVFDVRKDTPSSNMFTVSLMDSQFYTLCFI